MPGLLIACPPADSHTVHLAELARSFCLSDARSSWRFSISWRPIFLGKFRLVHFESTVPSAYRGAKCSPQDQMKFVGFVCPAGCHIRDPNILKTLSHHLGRSCNGINGGSPPR
jgi:hypothetical protein